MTQSSDTELTIDPRPAGSARQSTALNGSGDRTGHWGAIDLNLLIVFDALMRERNLTRAGRLLGLSQPATSHALARLRHMLHDDLFIRSPDGMQPTPRAQQMAEPIRDALRVLRLTLEPEELRRGAIGARLYTCREQLRCARDGPDTGPQGRRERAQCQSGHQGRSAWSMSSTNWTPAAPTSRSAQLVDGGERFKCVRVTDDDYVVILDTRPSRRSRDPLSAEIRRVSRMS